MRVKMTHSHTVQAEGSSTTFLADHFYLLPDDQALALVEAGVAELEGTGGEDEEL